MYRWVAMFLIVVIFILGQLLLATINERNAQVRELYLYQAVEWAKVIAKNHGLSIPVPTPRLEFFRSLNLRLDLSDPKHPEKRGIHQEGNLVGDEIHFPLGEPDLVKQNLVGTLTVNGKDVEQITFHVRLAPKDSSDQIGLWLNKTTYGK